MAKPFGGKRPQNLRHTLRRFMDYLGRHKIMLGVVGLLAAVSALAALLGTYMIRPIVNGVLENGSAAYLAGVVALTAGIYIIGVTKLIIAQRITSVQSADLIVILDDGRLHAVGTHDELLAKDTIYQEIYHSQMKGGDADGEAIRR